MALKVRLTRKLDNRPLKHHSRDTSFHLTSIFQRKHHFQIKAFETSFPIDIQLTLEWCFFDVEMMLKWCSDAPNDAEMMLVGDHNHWQPRRLALANFSSTWRTPWCPTNRPSWGLVKMPKLPSSPNPSSPNNHWWQYHAPQWCCGRMTLSNLIKRFKLSMSSISKNKNNPVSRKKTRTTTTMGTRTWTTTTTTSSRYIPVWVFALERTAMVDHFGYEESVVKQAVVAFHVAPTEKSEPIN